MKKTTVALLFLVTAILFAQTGGNIQWTQIRSASRHGNGTKGQSSDGTGTSGNCAKFDASGNVVDAGAVCGTGSGSVTSVATSSPLGGGTITSTGTLTCATCVTSATSLTNNGFMFGAGSQASQTVTATVATAALNPFTSSLQGMATASGGGTTNFLRADGTWAAPAGSGSVSSIATTSPITGGTITTSGTIACATCTVTVGNGTIMLNPGAVASAACSSAATVTITGTATTDNVMVDFNADPTGTTGYTPSASGMITIIKYPTANTVNVKACNNTGASITPGSVTLNARVTR